MGRCTVCYGSKTVKTITNFATLVTCEHAPVCFDCIDTFMKNFPTCPQCGTVIAGHMSLKGKFIKRKSSDNNGNNNNGDADNTGNNGNNGDNANNGNENE